MTIITSSLSHRTLPLPQGLGKQQQRYGREKSSSSSSIESDQLECDPSAARSAEVKAASRPSAPSLHYVLLKFECLADWHIRASLVSEHDFAGGGLSEGGTICCCLV